MNLKDLRTLEIGLELYKLDEPLGGECESLIAFLVRVLRADISSMEEQKNARAERRKQKLALPEAQAANK